MELDRVPLWRGDHVAVKQLVEDFARYLYLPRLKDSTVLLGAIRDGVGLLTWEQDSFAFADSYDEAAGRYRGLRGGQMVTLADAHAPGLLVKPEVARRQMDAERVRIAPAPAPGDAPSVVPQTPGVTPLDGAEPAPAKPKRFHGTVVLDTDPGGPRCRPDRRGGHLAPRRAGRGEGHGDPGDRRHSSVGSARQRCAHRD